MTKFLDLQRSYPGADASASPEAADLIIHYLEQIGVEYVFGVPGGAIEPLYNALARSQRRGGIIPVIARHESGAAFMADGYNRETGRLGVCCTTTGPGATNIITGVASAYQDDIPMLVITAQTPLETFGRGAVQESSCTGINTVAMMGYCTHYSSLVSHVKQLERKLISAITTAFNARGPAHLSIPLDILRTPLQTTDPAARLANLIYEPRLADPALLANLSRRIRKSRHIVVVVGEGCREAMNTIDRFAEHTGALLITTPQAKGLVDSYHPNYRGVCGLAGQKSAQKLLLNPAVDLVLVAGSGLDEQAAQGWLDADILRGKLVHIDYLPRHFTRSQYAELHVLGNIEAIFAGVLTSLDASEAGRHKPWDMHDHSPTQRNNVVNFDRRAGDRRHQSIPAERSRVEERRAADRRRLPAAPIIKRHFQLAEESKLRSTATPVKPQRLMYDLSRLFPPDTCYLADIGNSFLWGIHYLHPYQPWTRNDGPSINYFRTSMGFASMGWAIGAAVGTAFGNPGRPVVCLVGDGSYLMSGQELTTAAMHNLCVIFVILNDGALGTVKHGQRLAGAEEIGYELPRIDYAALAYAMGVESYRVENPEDMQAIDIANICRRRAPTLIDVHIDGEEIPPLSERMDMLAGQW